MSIKMYNEEDVALWEAAMDAAKECLREGFFDTYDNIATHINNFVEQYKNKIALLEKCDTFGVANYLFENALPRLFEEDKKAVKDFTTLIKEDKNLLAQFKFFEALKEFDSKSDVKEYVNEAIDLVSLMIDKKTLKESNKKLQKMIKEYDLVDGANLDEGQIDFYQTCDNVLCEKKTLSNLNTMKGQVQNICEYVENNVQEPLKEDEENPLKLIEAFDKKYNKLLNEEERALVRDIVTAKRETSARRKEMAFDKVKNECLETIDKMLQTEKENKSELNAIRETIEAKEFCMETLVKDIAKMLEIKEILVAD